MKLLQCLRRKSRFWRSVALGLVTALPICNADRASAALFTWNHTATDWSAAGAWSPAGPPTTTDVANLATFANPSSPTTVTNPTLLTNVSVGAIAFGPNSVGGGYTLNGGGKTLFLGDGFGGNAVPALTVQGVGTTTFNSLLLRFSPGTTFISAGLDAPLSVRAGATLALVGTNIDFNTGVTGGRRVTVNGGTLRLDANSEVNTGAVSLSFYGGGQLILDGVATGSKTFTFSNLTTGSSDTIVTLNQPAGSSLTASFSSSGSGLTRLNNNATLAFTTGTANIVGDTGQPTVTFSTPVNSVAGVITEGTTNGNSSPYVILTNQSGADVVGRFAGYALKVVAAATSTVTDAAGLGGLTFGQNATFEPGSTVTTMSANVGAFTLAINPTANNQSLELGSNALNSMGILLSKGSTFSINGGSLTSGGTLTTSARNFFVVDPNGVLQTSMNLAGTSAAVNKAGPGFMVLTGTTDQVAFSALSDVRITGGVFRAVIQGASQNLGSTNNTLEFRGGVFEVDSQGGTSTFARDLGTTAGRVNWGRTGGTPTTNQGSGGFSAFNGDLTVNLGGAASALTWGVPSSGFVRDGLALHFGSTRSDSAVIWQNPINLDGGTAGTYQARVIQVTRGTGGVNDLTRLDGVLAGSSSTDLIKTGTGTLHLNATNTYSGNTIVTAGTLRITANENLGAVPGSFVPNNVMLNGGALEVAGTTAMTLHANRGILLGASNGTIAVSNSSLAGVTYAGVVAGPGQLTKSGSGTLSLTGANTFTGGVQITGGTLLASNTTGSATGAGLVDVKSGGTLGGTGTVAGAVTVRNGGKLAPGASPGTLTIQNSVTFESGASFQVEINGGSPGTLHDFLVIGSAGSLNLGSATLLGTIGGGYMPGMTDRLAIIHNQFAGSIVGTFNSIAQDGTVSLGTFSAKLSYSGHVDGLGGIFQTGGNDVVLYGFEPIPEPAHVFFLVAASAGAWGVWRRRRARS